MMDTIRPFQTEPGSLGLSFHFKTKCCGTEHGGIVPQKTYRLFKECGASDQDAASLYVNDEMNNSWFSSWGKLTCHLCGKNRVLVWYDGCSPSGECVSTPSETIHYWIGYDGKVDRKLYVCKWCKPDSKKLQSRIDYVKKLSKAMLKQAKEV